MGERSASRLRCGAMGRFLSPVRWPPSSHSRCLPSPVCSRSCMERTPSRVSWLPQLLNPSLGLFEAPDTLIMGGRTRRAAPGELKTGRKHPLRGRPDIPGHRQVHLLAPVPTSSPSSGLLVSFSSRDNPSDIRCPQPLKMFALVGTELFGGGCGSFSGIGLGGCSQSLGRGCPVEPGATHLQARAAAAHTSSDSKVYLASLSNVCSEPSEPPNSGWK